ncbi:MAG: aldo/keto reductase [Streptosporangiaceae bacterium]
MEERILGKTGRAVSVIGLGTWQLGADWGEVADADALATLEAAAQAGVTFLYTHDTTFAASDHRSYNRHGEAFDAGETFSGVDFDTGVDAAREFATLVPPGATAAQAALAWVIQQPGVSTVIPGARNPQQARQNAAAAELPPFTDAQLGAIEAIYDQRIRAQVHDRW